MCHESPSWKLKNEGEFFFHASRGGIGATHLYALPLAWQRGIGTEPPFSKFWIRHWITVKSLIIVQKSPQWWSSEPFCLPIDRHISSITVVTSLRGDACAGPQQGCKLCNETIIIQDCWIGNTVVYMKTEGLWHPLLTQCLKRAWSVILQPTLHTSTEEAYEDRLAALWWQTSAQACICF